MMLIRVLHVLSTMTVLNALLVIQYTLIHSKSFEMKRPMNHTDFTSWLMHRLFGLEDDNLSFDSASLWDLWCVPLKFFRRATRRQLEDVFNVPFVRDLEHLTMEGFDMGEAGDDEMGGNYNLLDKEKRNNKMKRRRKEVKEKEKEYPDELTMLFDVFNTRLETEGDEPVDFGNNKKDTVSSILLEYKEASLADLLKKFNLALEGVDSSASDSGESGIIFQTTPSKTIPTISNVLFKGEPLKDVGLMHELETVGLENFATFKRYILEIRKICEFVLMPEEVSSPKALRIKNPPGSEPWKGRAWFTRSSPPSPSEAYLSFDDDEVEQNWRAIHQIDMRRTASSYKQQRFRRKKCGNKRVPLDLN